METEARSEILPVVPAGATEECFISQSTWGAVRALWERGVAKKAIAANRRCRRGGRSAAVCWMGGRDSRAPGLPEVGFNAVVLHCEISALGYKGC